MHSPHHPRSSRDGQSVPSHWKEECARQGETVRGGEGAKGVPGEVPLAIKEADLEVALKLCDAALSRQRKHHHSLALLGRVPVVLGLRTKGSRRLPQNSGALSLSWTAKRLTGQHTRGTDPLVSPSQGCVLQRGSWSWDVSSWRTGHLHKQSDGRKGRKKDRMALHLALGWPSPQSKLEREERQS